MPDEIWPERKKQSSISLTSWNVPDQGLLDISHKEFRDMLPLVRHFIDSFLLLFSNCFALILGFSWNFLMRISSTVRPLRVLVI